MVKEKVLVDPWFESSVINTIVPGPAAVVCVVESLNVIDVPLVVIAMITPSIGR